MKTVSQLPLAPYTSFHCGGTATTAVIYDTQDPIDPADFAALERPLTFMGFGCNVLVSDEGLPGTTILFRAGNITQDGDTLIADAGVWWDDLVQYAINRDLWGLELTSYIPGSVGAAVVGNIAAYGQAVSDTLAWVELLDTDTGEHRRYTPDELGLEYRNCQLLQGNRQLLVIRAAFTLSRQSTGDVVYDSATKVADEFGYDLSTLDGRRQTILEARRRAGSLWDYRDETAARTAGSFFRNPMVAPEVAERIMDFDETGKSHELLRKMNTVHGGNATRVSAAHVLLACGYERGQVWPGGVRLHPQHVLKIENYADARAQSVYDVAHEIMAKAHELLGVDLSPEIRFVGEFQDS